MSNFFIKRIKNEDGAVLITSLLFLMVVTVLSVIGIQSPKTDILISANGKFKSQAQQLATLGVMEAKNWLEVHYHDKGIPLNAGGVDFEGNMKYFVVARPHNTNSNPDNDVDSNFSRAGILSKTQIQITEPENLSSPERFNTGPTIDRLVHSNSAKFGPDSTVLKNYDDKEIGTYEWNIIRVTSPSNDILSGEEAPEGNVDAYLLGLLPEDIFKDLKKISSSENGEEVGIGDNFVYESHFYLASKAKSEGLIAESEATVRYEYIVPSTD